MYSYGLLEQCSNALQTELKEIMQFHKSQAGGSSTTKDKELVYSHCSYCILPIEGVTCYLEIQL